jgi:hypothetical protein
MACGVSELVSDLMVLRSWDERQLVWRLFQISQFPFSWGDPKPQVYNTVTDASLVALSFSA